jgi:hypothetical protein
MMSETPATQDDAPQAPRVEWLTVAGEVDTWRSLGFTVTDDGVIPLVGASIRLVDPTSGVVPGGDVAPTQVSGIVGWALSGLRPSISVAPVTPSGTQDTEIDGERPADAPQRSVDGLTTEVVAPAGPVYADHRVGASGLDHVVVLTSDLERTSEAITAATGCELKRIREVGAMRQGFHRIGRGGLIVELVERPDLPDGPASFWGLVVIVDDIDAACELIGPDRISAPKDAVQPGRRIATVRADVGLGLPLALMTH